MGNLTLIESIKSKYENVYKLIFKDSDILEVSYIRKNDGKDILCLPVQTSCSLGCKFCHLTGLSVPTKNLSSERILNLVSHSLEFQKPENDTLLISYMGAGDSLMNLEQVIKSAVDLKNSKKYKYIQDSYKTIRFGVSTILPGYSRFNLFKNAVIEYKLPIKLHWSLHSLDAIERKSLMPAASPIMQSLNMINEYVDETGNPAEIHYTLMHEINDRQEDLDKFEKLPSRKATIKLLKFAEKESEPLLLGSKRTDWFRGELEKQGYLVEVYSPPGRDIGSSCGQFLLDQYTK
jgi:adenine C2-methylase RlmN of 23S rRNA A2503 and tRNA A37